MDLLSLVRARKHSTHATWSLDCSLRQSTETERREETGERRLRENDSDDLRVKKVEKQQGT